MIVLVCCDVMIIDCSGGSDAIDSMIVNDNCSCW